MQRLARGLRSPVAGGVVLVLVVRALVALSRADELDFELDSGSMAWALLNGMPLDPVALPVIEHQRGSIVTSLLCVPCMALLGPTFAALKATALLWSAAAAALFVAVLERHVGRFAAWTGAVLFALLPPSFQIVDVMALGSHGQTIPFLFAGLLAVLGIQRGAPPSRRRTAALGAILGLGFFMSLQFLVAVPLLFALWLQRDRGVRAPAAAVALGLGALAWSLLRWAPERTAGAAGFLLAALAGAALLAASARWRALSFFGAFLLAASPIPLVSGAFTLFGAPVSAHFLGGGAGPALGKLALTLEHGFRRAWLFEEHGGAWASWLYALGLLSALIPVARRALARDSLALFLLAYPLAWLLAYVASDLELNLVVTEKGLGSRYAMPVLPCLAAWVALAAADGARSGAWRGALWAAPCALAGAAGVAALLDPVYALRQPPRHGTELGLFREHLVYASGGDPAVAWQWAERLDPDWADVRPLTYDTIRLPRRNRTTLENLLQDARDVRAAEAHLRPCLWSALGQRAAETDVLDALLPTLEERLEKDELAWILRGAGRGWLIPTFYRRLQMEAREQEALEQRGLAPEAIKTALDAWRPGAPALIYEKLRALPPELARPVAEGAGFFVGYRLSPYQTPLLALLPGAERLPEPLRATFLRCAGAGYRANFFEATWYVPRAGALRVEASFSPPARELFRAGMGRVGSPFADP